MFQKIKALMQEIDEKVISGGVCGMTRDNACAVEWDWALYSIFTALRGPDTKCSPFALSPEKEFKHNYTEKIRAAVFHYNECAGDYDYDLTIRYSEDAEKLRQDLQQGASQELFETHYYSHMVNALAALELLLPMRPTT